MVASPQFTTVTSHAVALPIPDIDTDQITPARFLKTTNKQGLSEVLFADWRTDHAFVLNRPEAAGAKILVAGDNFGCGSSREHAPWALVAWGFRVVISSSFADIFKNNALKNGLVPVTLPTDQLAALFATLAAAPRSPITVDLVTATVTLPGQAPQPFAVDPFAQHRLVRGIDELDYMLGFEADIAAFETSRTESSSGQGHPCPN